MPVRQWPTADEYATVTKAFNEAYNTLERLEFSGRYLNGEYDPADVAAESIPVTSEAIANAVHFLMETSATIEQLNDIYKVISEWPELLAHIRVEQPVESDAR
jgi:hypothetical protein